MSTPVPTRTEFRGKEIDELEEDSLAWDNSGHHDSSRGRPPLDRGGGGKLDIEQRGDDPMVSISIPEHHGILFNYNQK